MTVESLDSKFQYNCNGSTTEFAFTDCLIYEASHLVVTLSDFTGLVQVDTVLTLDTHYTVSGVGSEDGGSITTIATYASGFQITIQRVIPLLQQSEYVEATKFPSAQAEKDFDFSVMRAQQLAEVDNRTLKFPASDPIGINSELPPASERAGQYLTFDLDGAPALVSGTAITEFPASSFWAGVAPLAEFASRKALGLQSYAENLIINPTFYHPLAAGFPAAPADNDFVCPGWRILMEGANAVVPTLQDGSTINATDSFDSEPIFVRSRLRLTVGSADDLKFGIFQVMEGRDVHQLRRGAIASVQAYIQSSTATLSAIRMALLYWSGATDAASLGNSPISAWGAAGTNPTLAANWNYIGTPANLSVNTGFHVARLEGIGTFQVTDGWNYGLLIWVDDKTTSTGNYIEISNVQVEVGSVCTEFVFPNQQQEIARIQRRYEYVAGNAKIIGHGTVLTSTTAKIFVPMQVFKRIVPTLAISSVGHFTIDAGTGTPVTCTGITLNAASTQRMAMLDVTVASGLTAGRSTYMLSANASATMEFKAQY